MIALGAILFGGSMFALGVLVTLWLVFGPWWMGGAEKAPRPSSSSPGLPRGSSLFAASDALKATRDLGPTRALWPRHFGEQMFARGGLPHDLQERLDAIDAANKWQSIDPTLGNFDPRKQSI